MKAPSTSAAFAAVVVLILAGTTGSEARLTNAVTDWVNATQATVATHGIQNQLSSKYYGLVGLAAHQAISQGDAPAAALAAYAGHAILSASFPWRQGTFDVLLDKQLKNFTAEQKASAKSVAVPVAKALLKDREADASVSFSSFKPAAEGTKFAYQFVPNQQYSLYPQLATATPFVTSDVDITAIVNNKDPSKGPVFQPPKNDYAKTYELGAKNSTTRKQYDTDSAFFWADGANTSAITGHWLDIAREVLPEDYSIEDTALFFARAGVAIYDASIAGWKVKYSTLHWRPITAFSQGYPGFTADPKWTPLLNTPSHPEYPSGHQVSVGAVLEVIIRTLGGKDKVTFTIGSEGTPWLKRTYKSLTAAAVEVGDSRLYGGVHFPSANADGLKLGRLVASKVFDQVTPKVVAVRSADGTGVVAVAASAKPAAASGKPATAGASGTTTGQKSIPTGQPSLNRTAESTPAKSGRRLRL